MGAIGLLQRCRGLIKIIKLLLSLQYCKGLHCTASWMATITEPLCYLIGLAASMCYCGEQESGEPQPGHSTLGCTKTWGDQPVATAFELGIWYICYNSIGT